MAKRPRDSVEREIMDIIPERFDGDPNSQAAKGGSRTRWILSVALGLLALAAIGVAARQLLFGDAQQPAAESSIPVVKADEKPIKTKPDDPGGMAVPNKDKLVYQDIGKGDQSTTTEKLLPPAEKPQVPATKAPADSAAGGTTPDTGAKGSDIPPPPAVGDSTASNAMPAPATDTPKASTATSAAAATASGSNAATAAPADIKKKDSLTPMKPTTTASAAPAPAPAPAHATGGGTWQVQLGALKSEADAQAAWKKAQSTNKDLLGSLTMEVQKADLGAKGTFYRVRVGSMDEAAAKSLCAELTKRNQGCIVARK